ncbi:MULTISPECIES: ABC transporter transmembrane domain-containing protein [unclassified Rhizobium]|uniref:ABC transporter transmembrane domain-containing protein n=1 Tax=unclassified Rhizobium TaxID=2613769 RepID=UPI000646142A|nr:MULTISPECIES: ABC transporter transmembrane domain-containing protein [unclassified Rhizobium]MBN8949462.1 ATP-binding cassette domain-containing protein [Rhizobium tropici]OJY75251.1 MAG: ABC transporter [Rhizobium sp. 60-20]RKD70754.1 ATP-binding cassette subfamily B protein [Rhizobium sp. WW_1]
MSETGQAEEKKNRSIRPLGRLAPYLRRYRGMVTGAIISLVIAAVTSLALPVAVRRMIDHGFDQADRGLVDSYFVAIMIMALLLAAASALRYYFVISIGERIVSDMRREVFDHVTRLSPSFFDVNQSGEIVSRLTADTTQIKSAVGATASVALRNLILCLGAVIMMIVTSPKLSSIVLIAIPIIVLPLVSFGRSVRKRSRAAQETLAQASAYANETIAANRTIQAYNGEDAAAQRYGSAVEDAYRAARAAIRSRSLLTGFAIAMVFGSIVAVLWVGAQNVLAGTMSAGTLGQFLLYSVIAGSSLGSLSEVWGELSQAAGAADRLSELLAEVSPIAPPANPLPLPQPPQGRVEFSDVHFFYPSRPNRSALHGLTFSVKPGETVAIVGASGAGKSTIFSLLLRFYDPQKGRVALDGVDARDVMPDALRERIAIVPQDTTIFAASIHDNIAFGRPGASRDDVRAAAIAAQAHEFISRLEEGYDTGVGERGVTLSGGQRQRIAIARAILKNAPILLLDEATSALDAESETLVQKALEGLMEARTTLVIAHRLATVLKADRILVLDQGRIVEEGTHQSLIRHGGIYAKLARLQFDAGIEEHMLIAK